MFVDSGVSVKLFDVSSMFSLEPISVDCPAEAESLAEIVVEGS